MSIFPNSSISSIPELQAEQQKLASHPGRPVHLDTVLSKSQTPTGKDKPGLYELLDSPPAGNSNQEGLRARKPHKSYPPQPCKRWNEQTFKAALSNGQNIPQTPNNCTHLPTRNSLKGKIGIDGGSGGCSNKPYLCDNMFHKSKQPDQTFAWKESK